MECNVDGLMTAMVDANGNRTAYAYDGDGLLIGISDPADLTGGSAVFTSFDKKLKIELYSMIFNLC